MHQSEILREELARLRARTDHPLTVVETGSIRSAGEQYRSNDGWSTLTFAEWAAGDGGRVVSIDLDTSIARKVLASYGLADRVELRRGDSLEVLHELLDEGLAVDLLFLDSGDDPDLILREYLLGSRMVRAPGAVLVDDAGPGATKADRVIPWLDRAGVPYRIEQRNGTTYTTGVLIVERAAP